jgi:hypothetical protein
MGCAWAAGTVARGPSRKNGLRPSGRQANRPRGSLGSDQRRRDRNRCPASRSAIRNSERLPPTGPQIQWALVSAQLGQRIWPLSAACPPACSLVQRLASRVAGPFRCPRGSGASLLPSTGEEHNRELWLTPVDGNGSSSSPLSPDVRGMGQADRARRGTEAAGDTTSPGTDSGALPSNGSGTPPCPSPSGPAMMNTDGEALHPLLRAPAARGSTLVPRLPDRLSAGPTPRQTPGPHLGAGAGR